MTQLDEVILVDETDRPIGTMDKIEAHRGQGRLHRAISVYLFDDMSKPQPQLLVQQRSAKKIVGAGQWANTVCGNVRPGETYLQCAQRRLCEELGIEAVEIQPVYKFRYQVQCNDQFSENEIDQVFVGRYPGSLLTISPNPAEVARVNWFDFADLTTTSHKEKWSVTQPVQYQDNSLAPWFVWMMRDQELVNSLHDF